MNLKQYCKECGGKCCTDPYFTHDEYIAFVMKIGCQKAMEYEPRKVGNGWKFRPGKCPGLTEKGCILDYRDRPILCRAYPFIPVPTAEGKYFLTLALRTCPAWREFGEHYDDQVEELAEMGVMIG